jgi:pimeloyl-ACP methyl ester carboxylesterase
LVDIK